MTQVTLRKATLVCQSSAMGTRPTNLAEGEGELTLAFCAPRALVAVSWSPLKSIVKSIGRPNAFDTLTVLSIHGIYRSQLISLMADGNAPL